MEKYYSVSWKGSSCGKVSVRQQGLYYCFRCRCILDCDKIYRLMLSCGDYRESLGVLVPDHDAFTLTAKLPAKRIGEGEWSFHIAPKQEEFTGIFVPIKPEEPFAYISRLKESFLLSRNGQVGIRIENLQE